MDTRVPMGADLIIPEDFQRSATTQGKSFEQLVEAMLKISGWSIIDTHAVIEGLEVDIVAIDPTGLTWWIECKGSWRGLVPGSRRGDTVKKAVAVAWYLNRLPDHHPYMLVTSHLPNAGTVGARLLDAALADGLFAQINTVGFILAPVAEEDE